MAFRFRLARVLRLRTQLRRQAQEQVARVAAELARVREEEAAVRAARTAVRTAEEAALTGGVAVDDLRRGRAWEDVLDARATDLARAGEETVARLGHVRDGLVTRRKEERQLERLGDRARERHEAEEERAGMVLLDDLVLRRRGR
ncbi:MAG: hypothetical protein U0807_00650 [Candidatus Binatia bacterium]